MMIRVKVKWTLNAELLNYSSFQALACFSEWFTPLDHYCRLGSHSVPRYELYLQSSQPDSCQRHILFLLLHKIWLKLGYSLELLHTNLIRCLEASLMHRHEINYRSDCIIITTESPITAHAPTTAAAPMLAHNPTFAIAYATLFVNWLLKYSNIQV